MKKILGCGLAVLLVIPLAFGTAFGASAKATCGTDDLIAVGAVDGPINWRDAAQVALLEDGDTTNGEWTTIFVQDMHCANNKDVFIDVSLEAGLYTLTKVSSQQGTVDRSTADAGLRVRVLVDGNATKVKPNKGALLYGVDPDYEPDPNNPTLATLAGTGVSFARRYQQLEAKFAGIVTECPAGSTATECFEDEYVELILSTLNAHSFNFIAEDVTSGTHTIEVQAIAVTAKTKQGGAADAKAYVGAGSVTMEEVRMIKDEDDGVPSI